MSFLCAPFTNKESQTNKQTNKQTTKRQFLEACADPGGGAKGALPPPPPHKILLPQIVRRGPRGPWPPLQNPGSAYVKTIHY